MREWFAFDIINNWYMVRFDVSDGRKQFHYSGMIETRGDYLRERERALIALRALMKKNKVREKDLIPLTDQLRNPMPSHRPGFLPPA